LLYIHAQERWQTAFSAVGIRTATDLLNCAGVRMQSDTRPDLDSIATLATAINAAQGYSRPAEEHPGTDTPATDAQIQGQTAGTFQTAMSSTPITAEILRMMFTAIRTGPNIDSVLRFWEKKQAD
jgi:hypothetical protein